MNIDQLKFRAKAAKDFIADGDRRDDRLIKKDEWFYAEYKGEGRYDSMSRFWQHTESGNLDPKTFSIEIDHAKSASEQPEITCVCTVCLENAPKIAALTAENRRLWTVVEVADAVADWLSISRPYTLKKCQENIDNGLRSYKQKRATLDAKPSDFERASSDIAPDVEFVEVKTEEEK